MREKAAAPRSRAARPLPRHRRKQARRKKVRQKKARPSRPRHRLLQTSKTLHRKRSPLSRQKVHSPHKPRKHRACRSLWTRQEQTKTQMPKRIPKTRRSLLRPDRHRPRRTLQAQRSRLRPDRHRPRRTLQARQKQTQTLRLFTLREPSSSSRSRTSKILRSTQKPSMATTPETIT